MSATELKWKKVWYKNWWFAWSIEELKIVMQAFQICESDILYGQWFNVTMPNHSWLAKCALVERDHTVTGSLASVEQAVV